MRGNAITDKPMVVMIDQGSASASEIFLVPGNENQRPQLIGQKTSVKGWFRPSADRMDQA